MVVANTQVDLAALKSRHSLGDVVEAAGVQLRGRGRVRQGVCPFHQESEGSFTVYGDTERFHCFGCGATGDVLDFIQRAEGLTLPEAIQRLGGGTGLAPSPAVRSRTQAAPRRTAAPVVPQRDPAALSAATRFYLRSMLQSSEGREYLASRGISFDTACRLGLGYAPGDGLRRYLEAAGFGGERLQASGLFTERGERFAGMVVVPDLTSGRVRWLVGRAIDPEWSPRFQALPGPKPVLGLGRLGAAPSWVVLTEGVFDWLALTQWGLPAVAALGTQGMERVAGSLLAFPRVFLAFDADDAGREAAERLESLLGRWAAVVTLLDGVADVAELATHPHGPRRLPPLACTGGARSLLEPPSHTGFRPASPHPPFTDSVPPSPINPFPWRCYAQSSDGACPAYGIPIGSPTSGRNKEPTHHKGEENVEQNYEERKR